MIRKKKKRVAVTVKNPFKELTLPFEGRRMLIRAEDIPDELSDNRHSGPRPTVDNNESGHSLSQEPDIIYMNSESRTSKTAKGVVMFKDKHEQTAKVGTSPVLKETLYDRTENPCIQVAGDNSFLEHTGVNHKTTDTTFNLFKLMKKVNSRQQRSNSKQTFKITEPKSNEETLSEKVQQSKRPQDDTLSWHISDGSTHSRGAHQATSNTRLKHVPLQHAGSLEDSCEHHHEEQPRTCKLESRPKTGIGGAKPESDKAIPYQIQMNVTPEARTHRYHVRRVKHFMEDDSSKYSYVIHVNCESDGDQHGSETEAHKSMKKRRGDIAKCGIFIKESSRVDCSVTNQDQTLECVSTEGNNNDVYTVSDRFGCCRSREKTEEAAFPECHRRSDKIVKDSVTCNDESSLQRNKSTDATVKPKVSRRLIDHLQRKESLQEESQMLSVSPPKNADIPEAIATQQVEHISQNLIRKWGRKRNAKQEYKKIKLNEPSNIVSRPSIPEKTMQALEDGLMIDYESKKPIVNVDINLKCNEQDKLQTLHDNEVFSHDFASANVNENRKQVNDIPNSNPTDYPSFSCGNRHEHTDDSETELLTTEETPETDNEYCYHSRTTTHQNWKEADIFEGGGKIKAGLDCDLGRYYKRRTIGKGNRGHFQSSKNDPEALRSPKMFNGIPRPSVTDKYTTSTDAGAETKSSQYNCNTERLGHIHIDDYETCTKEDTPQFTYLESPQHATSYVKPIGRPGRKNKFSIESVSNNNSQNIIDASPQDTDIKTTSAFPQMLKSPTLRHSPAINIALQNENHSNRMTVDRESSLFPPGATKRKRHRSKVPRFRHRANETDETGVSTFTELSKVLHEARTNSMVKCTAEKLKAAAHDPDEMSAIEACINSSFMGEYLRCLWLNQLLCDVRVGVGDEEIFVHKLVLAAYSSVFCPVTSRPEPTISFQINNSSPEAVRQIFAYMYTSNMALTDELLEPVINAAIVMGVQEVVDVVKGILSSPTMDNVNLYNGIIKRVGLDISLLDQEKIYRLGFSDLRHNSVYLGISVDELEGILMDPEVMVTNEAETVEMIISWIQYNYLQRIGCLDLLLRYVSFECIPPEDLVMLSEKYSHIFDTNAGSSFLCQAFKFHALNTGFPCVPNEDTLFDEPEPEPNISNVPKEPNRLSGLGIPTVKVYAKDEGLSALRVSLWGQHPPSGSPEFATTARTSVSVQTPTRSPPSVDKSTQHSPKVNKGTQSAPSTPMTRGKQLHPRPRYVSSRPTSPGTAMRYIPSRPISPAPVSRYTSGRTTPARITRSPRIPADYGPGQMPGYKGAEPIRRDDLAAQDVLRYTTPKPGRVTFNQPLKDSSPETPNMYQRNMGYNSNSIPYISRNNNATDEAIRVFLKGVTHSKPTVSRHGIHKSGLSVSQNGVKYRRDHFVKSADVTNEQLHPAEQGRHQHRFTKHVGSNIAGASTEDKHATLHSSEAHRHIVPDKETDREIGQCTQTNRDIVSCTDCKREAVQGSADSREAFQDNKSNKKSVHPLESNGKADRSFIMYREVTRCAEGRIVVDQDTVANGVVGQETGENRNVNRCTITNREVNHDSLADRKHYRSKTNNNVGHVIVADRNVVGGITDREVNHDSLADRKHYRSKTNNNVGHVIVADRNVVGGITDREVCHGTSANRNVDRATITNREAGKGTETYNDVEEGVQGQTSISQLSFTSPDYLANISPTEFKISEAPVASSFSLNQNVNAKSKEHAISDYQRQDHDDKECSPTDESNKHDFVVSDKTECKLIQLQEPRTSNQYVNKNKSFDKNTNKQSLVLLNHDEELSAFEVYKPHV